ncbi:MAG TPA: RICIN domain-containing protein [Polyangia bacterium]|nr:RICIN domain-containing protein [Polyangia bacterium]
MNGSTAVGTGIQQYANWDGVTQRLNLVQDGNAWRIAFSADASKCVDLVAQSVANGTQLALAACQPGVAHQQWTVSADPPTGAFVFKNVQSGRCLDIPGGLTASGARPQIWDCDGTTKQKFMVQAFYLQ